MESRTDETHLWTENQSGSSGKEGETFHRNQMGWTGDLEEINKDHEDVGTTIAGSAMMAISVFTNLTVIAIITSKLV